VIKSPCQPAVGPPAKEPKHSIGGYPTDVEFPSLSSGWIGLFSFDLSFFFFFFLEQ
jgi:hypothetical protein